jgi:hypothetical protein
MEGDGDVSLKVATRVAVMHVREGKFSEVWLHVDDQYALDKFLNSLVE